MSQTITLLTLKQIARDPSLVTERFVISANDGSEEILFRPLAHDDVGALLQFFECLSETTRRFATYPSYDLRCAEQFCQEIDGEDKFRMVAVNGRGNIIAVFELNLVLEESDIERYKNEYHIQLDESSDIQFAPCIIDAYQNRHLGSRLLQLLIVVAHRLGKQRMILWNGVMIDNEQAIRFYEKNNFQMFTKKFIADDGYECYDGILELT